MSAFFLMVLRGKLNFTYMVLILEVIQASFKYGPVIIVSSAAAYLPGSSRCVENPVLNSFGSTLILISFSSFLSCSVELAVYC